MKQNQSLEIFEKAPVWSASASGKACFQSSVTVWVQKNGNGKKRSEIFARVFFGAQCASDAVLLPFYRSDRQYVFDHTYRL